MQSQFILRRHFIIAGLRPYCNITLNKNLVLLFSNPYNLSLSWKMYGFRFNLDKCFPIASVIYPLVTRISLNGGIWLILGLQIIKFEFLLMAIWHCCLVWVKILALALLFNVGQDFGIHNPGFAWWHFFWLFLPCRFGFFLLCMS